MNKSTGMALVVALALTGCIGGSGGASTTPTSVSGNAAKGIVKNAKVLVCRIINGVTELNASCVSTTTGVDGSYSVTFSDSYSGPVMVTISPSTTGTPSTMLDETTGADIPYTLTMRAVASAVSGSTTIYVTPFSEMAAASAVSANKMDADTISRSIAGVQNLMGVDLSVMPIVNLKSSGSDSATLTAQAKMVAQLGNVVMAAKNSSSLTDANGVPCNVTSNSTSQQIACAVIAMANPAQSSKMLTAMNAQNLTSINMPIINTNGTMGSATIDMSSIETMQASIQSMLKNAGSAASGVAGMATTMSGGMMNRP